MNVLFIYPKPNENKPKRYGFSLNIAYSSSILKGKGFSTFLLDLSVANLSIKDILRFIKENEIEVVFVEFDSFALNRSSNDKNGSEIVRHIKSEYPSILIIAFGYACILEKGSIKYADITFVDDIFSHMFSLDECILKSRSSRGLIQYSFDNLPFPDRELFESISYYSKNRHSTLIQTSRGCLNKCIFCQRRGWQGIVQYHSDEYVLKEMTYIQNRQYKNIWVQDENFTFNLARAKRILRQWINYGLTVDMKIAISSWTKIDKEFLELASKANIKIISMGVESANQEVLQFYEKDIDLDNVKYLVHIADSLGIFTVGNFIIGAPMEDLQMIEKTFSFIKDSGFDQVNIKTLDYMIGSTLYESLPREKYPSSHYFCCLETGLGKYSLNELRVMKENFIQQYRKASQKRLEMKIKKYGAPYEHIFV